MTNVIKTKVNDAYCVDSSLIRMPTNDLSFVHPSLRSKTLKVDEYSGEVLSTSAHSATKKIEELTLTISKGRHIGNSDNVECLYMTVPTKVLHSDYFNGFNTDNISIVKEICKGSGLVDFSVDALLNTSRVTDTDFCQTTYIDANVDFLKYCKQLKKDTKLSADLGKGAKLFNNRSNQGRGIQWGRRESATDAYPFLKFYDKCLELSTKSHSFAQAHLQHFDYQNTIRKEVTVKNARHFKRHTSKDFVNTLNNVLSLSQDDMQKYMSEAIKIHLHKITAYQKSDEENVNLKPRDIMLYNYILRDIENKVSYYEIEKFAIQNVTAKERSRAQRHIEYLYDRAISEQKEASKDAILEVLSF